MKIDLLTKKDGFYKDQKDIVVLLKLIPEDNKEAKKKAKMNLSFVLDNSGSMDNKLNLGNVFAGALPNIFLGNSRSNSVVKASSVYVDPNIVPYGQQNPLAPTLDDLDDQLKSNAIKNYLNGLKGVSEFKEIKRTRFQLVVEATKQAITRLDENDFASIVLFSDNAKIIFPACAMTEENKLKAILALNSASTEGMTALHAGWVAGVEEVSKNLSESYINRVILLTDGDANIGETSIERIGSHVSNVYNLSVSTSTIGVGLGFKEDLLQAMATSGAGNSYFIDSDESVRTTFDMEFTGLSNTVAKEIKVKVKTTKDIELVKNLNMYQNDGEYFKIPNLSSSVINSVFVFKTTNKKTKSLNSIDFEVSYKDKNGTLKTLKIKKMLNVVSREQYENMDENQEVKVQELLNTIAEQKLQAQREYKKGNIVGATDLLARSVCVTNAVAASVGDEYKSLLQAEALNLNTLQDNAKFAGNENFSKILSYQSYRTRNSQE